MSTIDAGACCREYKKRLAKTLTELNGTEQDHKVLDELVAKFDGNKLRGRVPWLSGTRILPNTMIYFSSAPNGQLKVEGKQMPSLSICGLFSLSRLPAY